MSGIQDLIQHALDQNYNKASEVFGDIMTIKMNDIMDQEKIKLASQIYNNGTEVEASADEDEEDFEFSDEEEIIEPDEEDREDIEAIDNMSDEELEDAAIESDYDDEDDGVPSEDELEK